MAEKRDVDAASDGGNGDGTDEEDGTVPSVDLTVYQLSVSVSGRSDDELADVEATARGLMDYLVEQAERLEEGSEGRGVS